MNKINLQTFYSKYNKIITIILTAIFVLWRIPFINKGIDYTDTGYSMENYQNVFFGSGIDSIGVFLTTYIGGLIYKLLPAYHLLVYRILHWLIGLLTAFFAYRLFKRYMDKNLILILMLALALITKGGEALFSYYPVTSCLLMASLLLLHNGLVDNKKAKIFFAGVLSGLNIFVRLPNLLFVAMALGIIYYGWIEKQDKKYVFKLVLLYALGVLIVIVCIIPLIIVVMGADSLYDSLMGYVNLALGKTSNKVKNVIGVQEKNGHSMFAIVKTICIQCWKAVKTTVIFIIPISLSGFGIALLIKRLCKSENFIYKFRYVIIGAFYIIISFVIKEKISDTLFFVLSTGSVVLCLIMLLKLKKNNAQIGMLCFINIVLAACSVFGSDAGISRLNMFGNYIVLIIALIIIEQNKQGVIHKYELGNMLNRILLYIISFVIIACYTSGVFCKLPATYNDADYNHIEQSINSEIKALRGMKTSEQRADQINEYYDVMSDEELQDYEAIIFGNFPLGFIIGKQNNYFEDIQPCIDYPSVSVESLLRVINEKQEDNIKPLIIVSYVHQIQNGTDHFTTDAKMAVLDYMLELNEYEIYFASDNFAVYKPVE